ncbi:MAG: gliding motility-associated C-terminal domain-containing protein, partial [Candidatus Latescibacterota bacterium]|nr:gliding motility-associated C-terminal domain-containing protein [Candidatus Latescibacterota bacterium]
TIAPNPFTPNDDGINDRAEIRFAIGNLNVERKIQVRILDLSGRLVWQEIRMSFGEQVLQWNGRDAQGMQVPPGIYLCRIEVDVDAQDSSHQVAQRVIAVAY